MLAARRLTARGIRVAPCHRRAGTPGGPAVSERRPAHHREPHQEGTTMRARIQLDLDQLAVSSFETQPPPPAEQANVDNIRTCLNTACPPYHCCA
jgi:hypothetical protein